MDTLKQGRQERALARLKAQLSSGVKPGPENQDVPLTERDINRINAEIATLKTRVK